jgi:hypothetical protein
MEVARMFRTLMILLAYALAISAADIEIGFDELPSNNPFCGDCAASMRYQTLYLEEELGQAITIESISLRRTPQSGASSVTLDTLAIYIGYSSVPSLGNNFDGNYQAGTRSLVFWEEDVTVSAPLPDEWFQIDLEDPFFYNGTGNLIIEYSWPSGSGAVYNWNWSDDIERSLTGEWEAVTGFTTQDCPHILLSGDLSLHGSTFGEVKAILGTE